MAFFVTPYTIHFDDTMAYGSHHFMTSFKFQCEARESLLYGDWIFDQPGVPEALDKIHLFTADAYARNLNPAYLGDRLAILLSLEEWGLVSARFCYRVINQKGEPVCAGFQTHVCADAKTGNPIPLPEPIRKAYDSLRNIEEAQREKSFRDSVLSGGEQTTKLFTPEICQLALSFLADRHPVPKVLSFEQISSKPNTDHGNSPASVAEAEVNESTIDSSEVWVFPGQGAFDAKLLSERIQRFVSSDPELRSELDKCAKIANEYISGDAASVLSGDSLRCSKAVEATPALSQIAIYFQGIFGAKIRENASKPAILMGHSFGEITALTVAGCLDLKDGVLAVCQRVKSVREFGPTDGKLQVALTNRSTVAEEIAILQLRDVVIAGRNHENQTVVSGPASQLERLRKRLREMKIESIDIPSPTSFHHPALQSAANAWLQELRKIRFRAPKTTVYSPIGRRMFGAQDDIATVLSAQFLRPFDLQGALDDIVMSGVTRFVDCGSSGMLKRLITAAGPSSIEVISVDQHNHTTSQKASVATSSTLHRLDEAKKKTALLNVDSTTVANAPSKQPASLGRPTIAIVQQGCLLPAGATSPAELLTSILYGRSGIYDQREIDPYWEHDFYSQVLVPDRSTSGLAGLVNNEDIVAPANVDKNLFIRFSRAQKLLCVAIAPCIAQLKQGKRILCYVGATADGFQDQDHVAALRYAGIDPLSPEVAARNPEQPSAYRSPYEAIREVFDKVIRPGLDITLIDAACASSLFSVTLGMSALENSETDLVLAGGIYCPGPGNNCLFSQFGGLTSTGCRPFDAHADGVVFAEGAAFVLMKRLADAKADGDGVVAVIRAAGLSSDGRSPSANVPQTAGQLIAVKRCYENYDVSPNSIAAIEGHGTSTPAGDSTEVKTLGKFFAEQAQSPILLHSLKGSIGHTGWAAGTASIIAASEVLRTRTFPAQLNFNSASKALDQAKDVLTVLKQPLRLRPDQNRIAIDGFGFGGANAHVVLESPNANTQTHTPLSATAPSANDSELVLVAFHQKLPTIVDRSAGRPVLRFDRTDHSLPNGMVLLPDLVDDMDITQRLSLATVGGVLAQFKELDSSLRAQTSIVLVVEGKTERASEATLRVLKDRLLRDLAGLPEADLINQAAQRSRPSGAYTLQCMMPNVAAGRAALQFNLNGPNFVVDAGSNSIPSAFQAARLLLQNGKAGGTKLAIVAAIGANRWPVPNSSYSDITQEYAVAFGVTTRQYAREFGLTVLKTVDEVLAAADTSISSNGSSTELQLKAVVNALEPKTPTAQTSITEPAKDLFDLHGPMWVESPLEAEGLAAGKNGRVLAIMRVDDSLLTDELLKQISSISSASQIVLVGEHSHQVAASLRQANVRSVDVENDDAIANTLSAIAEFGPNMILAMDRPGSWELSKTLDVVAGNELCEFLFCAMKQFAASIRSGAIEVWGLFPGAWDQVIHPITGPIAGLTKAAKREMPDSKMGVIGLQSRQVRDSLRALQAERSLINNSEQEVVYEGTTRYVRRLRRISDLAASMTSSASKYALDTQSVVIATGGAKGVTALMAEALMRDYGCTILALGRSPLQRGPKDPDAPEVEQQYYENYVASHPGATPVKMKASFKQTRASWEAYSNIEAMSKLGRVHYIPIDINDAAAVDRLMADIHSEFGRVDMIIHGAGVQYSKRLEDRKLSEFRQTFGIKISGLQRLVAACLKQFGKIVPAHLLSSAYSIFGNDGQHDYGSANETLDRLCGLMDAKSDLPWTSIAWSAWDGVGMTQGSEYQALAARRNLALLEAPEGQRIFRKVINSQWPSCINVPLSAAERTGYRVRTVPAAKSESILRTAEFPIPLAKLDYLVHHQARGIPTLPGAWIINDMVRTVLDMHQGHASYVTVNDIQFLRFVKAHGAHDPQYRLIVDQTALGYNAWLIGNIVSPNGVDLMRDEVFATASLALHSDVLQLSSVVNTESQSNNTWRYVNDPYCNNRENVRLSGPFDCLQNVAIGGRSRHALFAPQINGAWQDVVPALLLDASIRVAGMHVVHDSLHVPTRIERVMIPIGVSSESLSGRKWRIQANAPKLEGDNIHCGRVEMLDHVGALKGIIEGAVVSKLH